MLDHRLAGQQRHPAENLAGITWLGGLKVADDSEQQQMGRQGDAAAGGNDQPEPPARASQGHLGGPRLARPGRRPPGAGASSFEAGFEYLHADSNYSRRAPGLKMAWRLARRTAYHASLTARCR